MDPLHAPPPPPPSLSKIKKSLLHLHNILTVPTASTPFLLFWLHLSYILALSFAGFLLLQSLPMKHPSTPKPSHLDFFFTSVSANTISSMAVVEMESFSNSQLLLIIILMLLGGEVFTSMLPLLLLNHNHKPKPKSAQLELILVESSNSTSTYKHYSSTSINSNNSGSGSGSDKLNKYLGYLVLSYFVALHATGWAFIMGYWSLFPATLAVVESRGIKPNVFAVFTVVSSFANCGFIPTNENMIVFRSSPGILLAVCGLVLLGNTLFPVALRCVVWVLKVATRRREFELILRSDALDGYVMRSGAEAGMLGATVGGLVVVQVVLFAMMEWGSEGLKGMTAYEKMVGSVFMSVNSRHAGEAIVDLSLLSSAILVLFAVMM